MASTGGVGQRSRRLTKLRHPLRVTVLDHFFGQDIDALRSAAGPAVEWRVLPYWRLREKANRRLPTRVQEGLSAFADPALSGARARYAAWLRREVARLYCEWPFDVFVLPSDTFYYVRALPAVCHELGIPVLVAQKETTITDRSFGEHVRSLRAYAPFNADYMTCCSERHKRFWVEAGADATRIEVTGQPRFDLYASGQPRRSWAELELEDGRRTVLFLSYQVDAYLRGSGLDWRSLREETESALWEAAGHGWRIVVKLHPQQPRADVSHMADVAPGFGHDVVVAPADADTRVLLVLADAVVGFQSTALLEAIALRKPVAYAAWGDVYEKVLDGLIPFHSLEDAIELPGSADELVRWLGSPSEPTSAAMERRVSLAETFLGPFDGKASHRTLAALERLSAAWREERERAPRRRRLDRLTLPAALGLLGGKAASVAAYRMLALAGKSAGVQRIRTGAEARRSAAAESVARARRTVTDTLVRGVASRFSRVDGKRDPAR
jgi:CDP-Glycerol:Poly(glycerophosphate) glycerophosphotransferase